MFLKFINNECKLVNLQDYKNIIISKKLLDKAKASLEEFIAQSMEDNVTNETYKIIAQSLIVHFYDKFNIAKDESLLKVKAYTYLNLRIDKKKINLTLCGFTTGLVLWLLSHNISHDYIESIEPGFFGSLLGAGICLTPIIKLIIDKIFY